MSRPVTTPNGATILLDEDDNWIGCPGVFGEDDLLDIIEAMRNPVEED